MRGGVTCSMAAARAIMHAVTSSVPAQADRLMEETISGYRRGDFVCGRLSCVGEEQNSPLAISRVVFYFAFTLRGPTS
jgi:hypothetical protein